MIGSKEWVLVAAIILWLTVFGTWVVIDVMSLRANPPTSYLKSNISKVKLEDGKYICFLYKNVANGTQTLSCLKGDS